MTVENLEIAVATSSSSAAKEIDRLADSIRKIKAPTAGITKDVKKMSSGFNTSANAVGKFVKSLGRIAFYRAIRTVVKEVTQAFQEGLKNAYHFSKGIGGDLAAALDTVSTKSLTMKNQLGSAFGGLLQAIQPILLRIIELIRIAANAIAAFFGALNGGTYLKAKDTAAAWDEATGAAQKYRNTILGFDEINRLDDQGGGGGGASPNYNDMFTVEEVPPGIQKIADFVETLRTKIEENLAAIEFVASTATLALGLILAISGANIPLGVALIAAGAYGMAKELKENWDKIPNSTKEVLGELGIVAGGASLALGMVLAFSGANIPLGIGLIAAGISTVTAVALAWDKLPTEVQEKVSAVGAIVSGGLLALGAVIAFSGASLPIGIGLMAAGALGLASTAAINWEAVSAKIKSVSGTIGSVLGGSLLVLGALLTFSGVALPLGIGLMAAGAATLAGAAALNWDYVKERIESFVAGVLAVLSAAGAVLGIILCLSPATLPLGIGLLYASLKGSASAFNMDDNAVTRTVLNFALKIETYINTHIISPLNSVLSLINQIFGTNYSIGFLTGAANELGAVNANGFSHYAGKFAGGGFPSRGDLFIAGEAGAEIVSSHGGQTQVSNTDQIAYSVQAGNGVVVDAIYAMANAIVSSVDRKDTRPVVTIGDREVYHAWERGISAVGESLVHG